MYGDILSTSQNVEGPGGHVGKYCTAERRKEVEYGKRLGHIFRNDLYALDVFVEKGARTERMLLRSVPLTFLIVHYALGFPDMARLIVLTDMHMIVGSVWCSPSRGQKPQEPATKKLRRANRSTPQPPGCRTVFVKNLPYEADEDGVCEALSGCGKIASVRLAMWNHTRKLKVGCESCGSERSVRVCVLGSWGRKETRIHH